MFKAPQLIQVELIDEAVILAIQIAVDGVYIMASIIVIGRILKQELVKNMLNFLKNGYTRLNQLYLSMFLVISCIVCWINSQNIGLILIVIACLLVVLLFCIEILLPKSKDLKYLFWPVVFTSIGFFILFYLLQEKFSQTFWFFKTIWQVDRDSFVFYSSVSVVGLLFLYFLTGFIFDLPKKISIQFINNGYSAFRICFWAMFINFTVSLLLLMPIFMITSWVKFFDNYAWFCLIFYIPWVLFYVFKRHKNKNNEPRSFVFPYDSVGLKDDKLGMSFAVNSFVEKIKNIIKNTEGKKVNIVEMLGEAGQGKSSFSRMVVEKFEEDREYSNNFLYTYISLTETNQSKDLSHLFAERWFETLGQRYPIIDKFFANILAENILQEKSGNNFFGIILKCLPFLNIGLFTRSKVDLDFFAAIPEIKEKFWIVVVDEVDRAKNEEVYRLIEILERYKQNLQSDSKIKIIFVVNIAIDRYKELLAIGKEKRNEEVSFLIDNFIFEDQKSIDVVEYLPLVPLPRRLETLINLLEKNCDSEMSGDKMRSQIAKIGFLDYRSHRYDKIDREAIINELIAFIIKYSVRFWTKLNKSIDYKKQELERLFSTPLSPTYLHVESYICAEFLKTKYPEIVEFLKDTFIFVYEHASSIEEAKKDSANKSGFNDYVLKWIEENYPSQLEKYRTSIEDISFLFAIAFPRHHYYCAKHDNRQSMMTHTLYYDKTLFSDKKFQDYFGSDGSGGGVKDYMQEALWYGQHLAIKNDEDKSLDFVNEIPSERFDGYLHYCDSVSSNMTIKYHCLLSLLHRFKNENIQNESFVYEFAKIFIRLHTNSDYKNKAAEVLLEFLSSNNIFIEFKFILVGSLFGKTSVFKKENIYNAVCNILSEFDTKLEEKDFSIIKSEKNIGFLLYQTWSGSKDDSASMRLRRDFLREYLEKNNNNDNDWLRKTWNTLPDNGHEVEVDKDLATRTYRPSINNMEVYLTLEGLCSLVVLKGICKDDDSDEKFIFWKKQVDEKTDVYHLFFDIKDDASVLSRQFTNVDES